MQIQLNNLTMRFGPQTVLNQISATIKEGKTTAIVGPSGTGKSVLLKLITGLLEPTAGEVIIGDTNFTQSSASIRSNICHKIGMLFQGAALFDSLTLFENIEFPLLYIKDCNKKETHKRAEEQLDKFKLEEYKNELPGEVSIGIRKRVGIARAMVINPEILLFDEPNTGLDPMVGQEIYDIINQLRSTSNFTGIIVSHELPEVFQVCDHVIMLYNGQIHFEGSPDDFIICENPVVKQFISGSTDGPIQVVGN
jgi:phospholipid/cholesterol/gamma-HCH transport system ATP-binding protein